MTATTVPIVSVVIPAFNAARWIERTVRSALGQTFADIEVIVVDDGSTDSTAEICNRLCAVDDRLIVLRTGNFGVAHARNSGIAIARGEFIAPLDADDLWQPERLALHIEALRSHSQEYALVYSPFVHIDDYDLAHEPVRFYWANGYTLGPHLCHNFIGNGSGITVRSSAIRAIGGYSTRLRAQGGEGTEDYLAQLKLAIRYKFLTVPNPVIGYRRTSGNMSSNELAMRRSRVLALAELESDALDFPGWFFFHPRAMAALALASANMRRGNWKDAFHCLLSEATRNPLALVYLPFVYGSSSFTLMKRKFGPRRPAEPSPRGAFHSAPSGPLTSRPYPIVMRTFMRLYANAEKGIRRHKFTKSRETSVGGT